MCCTAAKHITTTVSRVAAKGLTMSENQQPQRGCTAVVMPYEERAKYACDVCGNVPDEDGMIEHGRGCYVVDSAGGGITFVEFDKA